MKWTPAPCGVALSNELDDLYGQERPNDGTVGDLAHSARASDHNPTMPRPPGWVDARDVYDWQRLDADRLMHALAASRDRRILYVISHGRMCSSYPAGKYKAWEWRPYSGPNGHFSHGHISFRAEHRQDRTVWLTPAVRAALGFGTPTVTPALNVPALEDLTVRKFIRRDDNDALYLVGPGYWNYIETDEQKDVLVAKGFAPAPITPVNAREYDVLREVMLKEGQD